MIDVTLPLRFRTDDDGIEWTYGHCCGCGYITPACGSVRGVRSASFEHLADRHPDVLARIIEANLGVPA